MERRLAAIFAADVAGYSRLMSQDEVGTMQTLTSHREVMDSLIAQHRGRIANTAGDSVLAEFPSVVDAVQCALEAQAAPALQNESLPEERRLEFRIGVHVGDVMVKGGDLFGDGVNIAARLQALAEPGGVCISASAQEHVRKALSVTFQDLGPQQVKNIEEPIRAYAVHPLGASQAATPTAEPKALALPDKPSIAVLPFENMSGDPEQVYFSDGITDDVITELSRFGELMVIARNSSFALRGKSMEVREIGRALGAAYLIEGNVRRAGNRVRITAQLIDVVSGTHLWTERYDRSIEDVFAVQEEIAQSIVATVAQRVLDAGEIAARRRSPQDIRAYDLFLRGLRLSDSFTPEAQAHVEAIYEQARAIDPTFARAYTGLALIHLNRSIDIITGVQSQPDEHQLSALRLAEQALALAPNDPRTHSTLAMICARVRDFERADRHFSLARAMNPNDAMIQIHWAWIQGVRGRPEDGMGAAELAYRLNPRHPLWYDMFLARLRFQVGCYAEAATLLEKRIFDSPVRNLQNLGWRVASYGHLGRLEEAARCGEDLVRGIASHWRGDPGAGRSDYMDWIVWASLLQQDADMARLRGGLRLASLPA